MSYETDVMRSLIVALNNTFPLQTNLKQFNQQADTLRKISEQLERMNNLKEKELKMLLKEQENTAGISNNINKIR